MTGHNQHRAPTRPERAASFKPFLVSGPDCRSVSRATVVSTASRGVARRVERPKALERESLRGAQPKTRLMLASRAHAFEPGTGAGGAESARMPGMVGRERSEARPESASMRTATARSREQAEGGSGERGGPVRTNLSSRPRRSVCHLTSWRTQKGRGRLGHRESRLSRANGRRAARERPRAFIVFLTQQPHLSQSYSLRDSEVI
jgi:hypothetical protein